MPSAVEPIARRQARGVECADVLVGPARRHRGQPGGDSQRQWMARTAPVLRCATPRSRAAVTNLDPAKVLTSASLT